MSHFPARPARPHVSARGIWFGVAMMVCAVVVLAVTLVLFFRALAGDSEVIDADGRPHQIMVPAGERYGVFLAEESATCEITDGDGERVDQGPVSGTYTVNDWKSDRSFRTHDGDLTVVCTSNDTDAQVRLGPLPGFGGLIALMFVGIGVSVLLGLGGLIWLIVTIVRRSGNRSASA